MKRGNKCRGSLDETGQYALRTDQMRHLFPRPALSVFGLAGLAVDLLDRDILAADGAADGLLTLARLLAQRDFLDHMSLLGNHRLLRGRGHLDRALAERLVGLLRLQGTLDPAALDIHRLFLESHGFLNLAFADLGLQALAAGGRGLTDLQLLLDHLGLFGLLALLLAAPLQQGLRGQHLELAHGLQRGIRLVVVNVGDDQGAPGLQRFAVAACLVLIIASLDEALGDGVDAGVSQDLDRVFVAAGLGQRIDHFAGSIAVLEQSDDGSRHGTFLSDVFKPERSGADQHPSRTCSQTCCSANCSEKTSGCHRKMPCEESILSFCPSCGCNNLVWIYDPIQIWHNRFRQSPLLTYKDYMRIEVLMEHRR